MLQRQAGYGWFSVSTKDTDLVNAYIENQAEHHDEDAESIKLNSPRLQPRVLERPTCCVLKVRRKG